MKKDAVVLPPIKREFIRIKIQGLSPITVHPLPQCVQDELEGRSAKPISDKEWDEFMAEFVKAPTISAVALKRKMSRSERGSVLLSADDDSYGDRIPINGKAALHVHRSDLRRAGHRGRRHDRLGLPPEADGHRPESKLSPLRQSS